MNTEEALSAIEQSDGPIQFANENPHWWIGRNSEGKFTYDYECCDLCEEEGNNDHETFDAVDELRERVGRGGDDVWIKVNEPSL